jgi:hypothetical protein
MVEATWLEIGMVAAGIVTTGIITLVLLMGLNNWYREWKWQEPTCDHLYGPVRKLSDDVDGPHYHNGAEETRADYYEVMEARCRKCGDLANMTYNVRMGPFPPENGGVERVEYIDDGRMDKKNARRGAL